MQDMAILQIQNKKIGYHGNILSLIGK